MATRCLRCKILFTLCQLGPPVTSTPFLIWSSSHASRFCHNGRDYPSKLIRSAGRFKRETTTDGFQVKLGRSNSEVILQLNEAICGNTSGVVARHSVQSRLETLGSLGCPLDQIQENPEILKLSETEVVRRVQRLKKYGAPLSVQVLKAASVTSEKTLAKRLQAMSQENKVDEGKFVCSILQCSLVEFEELKKKYSFFQEIKNWFSLVEKVEFLLKHGASLADIRNNPEVLQNSIKSLQKRFQKVKKLVEKGVICKKPPVFWLVQSEKDFRSRIEFQWQEDSEGSSRLELIAQLLDVKADDLKDIDYARSVTLSSAKKKISYLLSVGIQKRDIVNHFYLLRNSLSKLEYGVSFAREAGTPLTALLLINILQHRQIPQRCGHSRQQFYIASLLGTTSTCLTSSGPNVSSLWSVDRLTLRKNIEFLKSRGFTSEDILSCPLIIGHSPDMLQSYFDSLHERPELQPHDSLFQDKLKVINAVQYFLERDQNFNSKELISEAEGIESKECTDIMVV